MSIDNVPDPFAGYKDPGKPPAKETDPRKMPLGTPGQEAQHLLRCLLGARNAVRLALIVAGRATAVCGSAVGPPKPESEEDYAEDPPWTVEEFSSFLPTIVGALGFADDKLQQILEDTRDIPAMIRDDEFK